MPYLPPNRRPIIFTGQVGVNKGAFIEKVAEHLRRLTGEKVTVASTGDIMHLEDPGIPPGEILKREQEYLMALRRASIRRIMMEAPQDGYLLVSTHASFSWADGPFAALDFDLLGQLNPALFLCVIDNYHSVWARLLGNDSLEHHMRDVLHARALEMQTSLLYADATATAARQRGEEPTQHYFVARGPNDRRALTVAKLIMNPHQRKVYPSFPMTHVKDMPDVLAEIDAFRDELAEHFVTFDPGDVDEKFLFFVAKAAKENRQRFFTVLVDGNPVQISARTVLAIDAEVDRQICDRDFKKIAQSDIIISLIPDMPYKKPGLSSGVERELHRAFRLGKKVYVVWKPKDDPSPFIRNHATKIFRSTGALLHYFRQRGLIQTPAASPADATLKASGRKLTSKRNPKKPSSKSVRTRSRTARKLTSKRK